MVITFSARHRVRRRRPQHVQHSAASPRQINIVLSFSQGEVMYTLIAAANLQGFVVTACKALECIHDGETFYDWVEQTSAPRELALGRGEFRLNTTTTYYWA